MKFLIIIIKSIIIFEAKALKKKFYLIEYFIKNINFIEYIKFLSNRSKFNPIKIREFKKYIKNIKSKQTLNFSFKNKKNGYLLVESFINHPAYSLSNIVIGKYLQKIKGFEMIGVVRKFDYKSEVLFRAFGVKKLIFFTGANIFERIYYLLKAASINFKFKNINQSLNYKYEGIDVGMFAHDTYIRYLGIPTIKNIDSNYIIFFAETLYAINFFKKKIFQKKNISGLIQSETQFTPLNILFQITLNNNLDVFSRIGIEKFTVRHYTKWSQRYSNRMSFSQKLFDYIYLNYKKKGLIYFNKLYLSKIKNKIFGVEDSIYGLARVKNKIISKKNLLKMHNWEDKPIVVFFLSHLLDGNFIYGKRKNFKDIYSSTEFILNNLANIKNVNWLIKKHPNENYYSTKIDFDDKIKNLIKNNSNIKMFEDKIDTSSLLKIADLGITTSGSIALEYPAFNINSIFYESSYYSNLNFINYEKNPKKIFEKIKKINNLKKLNKNFVEKCRTYLFIKEVLLKNKSTLIPYHISSRKINEKKFWQDCLSLLDKFDFEKDEFFKMFEIQIYKKMRNTINNNIAKIKKKNFYDYED